MSVDRLRLLTKVARMYHERGIKQPEIAARLGMSQSRVSRSLKEASQLGIVRTSVVPPSGVHSDLEDQLRERYGLRDVIVADTTAESEAAMLRVLGSAGAAYLEATLKGSDVVGISSWSATLLAVAEAMSPSTVRMADQIVQVIGGVGRPGAQVDATRLAERFARVTGASPRFIAAPGLVSNSAVRDALLGDPFISDLVADWSRLSVVLVGIGSLDPSPMLRDSGNALDGAELERLREVGAVGDVCLHFFGEDGRARYEALDERVVGIQSETLRSVPRIIGIAGGTRKLRAIRGAVQGGWINTLITDLDTAEALLGAETSSVLEE